MRTVFAIIVVTTMLGTIYTTFASARIQNADERTSELSDSYLARIRGGDNACESKITPTNRWHYECGHESMEDNCTATKCLASKEYGDFCEGTGNPVNPACNCKTKDKSPAAWMARGTIYTYDSNACTDNGGVQVWNRWGWGGCNGSICSGHDIKVKCLRSSSCPAGSISSTPGHGSGGKEQEYC